MKPVRYFPSAAALAALAVFGLGLTLNLYRLSEGPYHLDELLWIGEGKLFTDFFSSGDFDSPYFELPRLTFGFASPPVGKLLIGSALNARGVGLMDGTVPPPAPVLAAARLPSAILGAIGALAFFAIARRIIGNAAGCGAALLLISSPVWLATSRWALVDLPAVAFSLVAVALFAEARVSMLGSASRAIPLLYYAATGLTLGLAVGSRFTAGGVALALGLLATCQAALALHPTRGDPRARALLLCAGVLIMSAIAVAVFIAVNPYLYDQPLTRVLSIIAFWDELWESRITGGFWRLSFEASARPVATMFEFLLLPGRAACWLLAPAFLVAGAARLGRLSRFGPHVSQVLVWSVATPALILASASPSRVYLAWVVWAGVVGALLSAVTRGPNGRWSGPQRETLVAFGAASIGACAMALRQTYVAIPRYYLPLLPLACLVAAWGFANYRNALSRTGGRRAGIALVAACALGALVAVVRAPVYSGTSMAEIAARLHGIPPLPGFPLMPLAPAAFQVGSAVVLAAIPIAWAWERRSQKRGDGGDAA